MGAVSEPLLHQPFTSHSVIDDGDDETVGPASVELSTWKDG